MQKYTTAGGMTVEKSVIELPYKEAIMPLVPRLDKERGAIFSSNFEYPGRYTRWDIGFVNPPLAITGKGITFHVDALNARGEILLRCLRERINQLKHLSHIDDTPTRISGQVCLSKERVAEEFRSKQPTIFTLIRDMIAFFKSNEEEHLGFYGAFGYDLVFQFEQLRPYLERDETQRDLVLYLPDELYVVDHQRESAVCKRFDFIYQSHSTQGLPRTGTQSPYQAIKKIDKTSDHAAGEYAQVVTVAKEKFKKGDLFEVVPGQTFFENCKDNPSVIFSRLRRINPSPYGFFINLGEGEYLVGASPEMFVRVQNQQVESCPISGTIERGSHAIGDAQNIVRLLTSKKDESELTMCTDVDRNDKARICKAGSIEVIGRRQIEMYSRLIHTVDHVIGELRDNYDALDAFLSHMWVVTVTGAPKLWAMQFIEEHEKSPRKWYGGSVGWLGFDGNMNTGLTLRTLRIKEGVAEIRVGATLLYDSDPDAEEKETLLKASAFIQAIRGDAAVNKHKKTNIISKGKGKKVLLLDHEDSFVHTLGSYFRQVGTELVTYRYDLAEEALNSFHPDLIVLSPGPGCPKDFNTHKTIDLALARQIPIFGVCLGLQALVEYFGGELGVLDYPMHGKPSLIKHFDAKLFSGLPDTFTAGRYHSLYAIKKTFPQALTVTAESEDGIIMAIEHKNLPISAVQFHPESILSSEQNYGLKLIANLFLADKTLTNGQSL